MSELSMSPPGGMGQYFVRAMVKGEILERGIGMFELHAI